MLVLAVMVQMLKYALMGDVPRDRHSQTQKRLPSGAAQRIDPFPATRSRWHSNAVQVCPLPPIRTAR